MSERSRPVTIADVAALAGVSRALVSIVLRGVPGASPANREKVLRAAAELDYHPDQRARLLGAARSRTLGVVHDLRRAYQGEVVEALYASVLDGAAGGDGWRLVLEPTGSRRPEAVALQALLDQRCEAVVLVGPTSAKAQLASLAARVPVVVLTRAVRGLDVDVVRTDDEAGARLATEHLLALGHTRIAHLHGGRAPGAAERRAGYGAALRRAGLAPELVAGGPTESDGESAAPRLLRPGGPTAVLAFNDACAVGLLAAARAGGAAVPRDLSIVGFDDSAAAALSAVALTTVGQDAAALAAHAVRRAVARAEDPRLPASETVVPPHLVARRTSAAPGASAG
ncbi:LacI family DNA-binding transcriptional regulator [Kineococcus rubinsiae]|uniref:LacI family DNA-binding transcriptional regulator n=1 Tax=Kineococcus rubinsiae TaxID=2609562 RepID=UPI00142F9BE3|nr:LacI family DNA-binding transcriptional regulator [Kineococcus rubinsiae]NIZ90462.1 LacI family transcriptional regulator [Kineococcus rubinsiae]